MNKDIASLAKIIVAATIVVFTIQMAVAVGREASLGQGGTTMLVRSLSRPSPMPGNSTVNVTLTITVGPDTECGTDPGLCNDYYVIDEYPPGTTTISGLTGNGCELLSGPRIACVTLQDAATTNIKYSAAFGDTPGNHTWGGTYMVQGDTIPNIINGTSIMEVKAAASTENCTASWACEPWSNCVNKQQTRTCRDNNQCGLEGRATAPSPPFTKTETQPCSGPAPPDIPGWVWPAALLTILSSAAAWVGLKK